MRDQPADTRIPDTREAAADLLRQQQEVPGVLPNIQDHVQTLQRFQKIVNNIFKVFFLEFSYSIAGMFVVKTPSLVFILFKFCKVIIFG